MTLKRISPATPLSALFLVAAFAMPTAASDSILPKPQRLPSLMCTATSSPKGCPAVPPGKTLVITDEGLYPPSKPFDNPPGQNFLPTFYVNLKDGFGREIVNSLPSTPVVPYNLHPAPQVSKINPRSPTDDLGDILSILLGRQGPITEAAGRKLVRLALDILEGERVLSEAGLKVLGQHITERTNSTMANLTQDARAQRLGPLDQQRAYAGSALLHYDGPNKVRRVTPIRDASGKVVGGNVNVHQVWYDNHIESDLALLNPVDVWDVPWTMTYTVDVLTRGFDDFSPYAMFTDDPAYSNPGLTPPATPPGQKPLDWKPWPAGLPHFGIDQTFFPMGVGTRSVFKIAMPPAKFWHLTYTWGWRWHPPRVQSTDRATKMVGDKTLVRWETDVFGKDPRGSEASKLRAIGMIGDLAPAKRMWNAFRAARKNPIGSDATKHFQNAFAAFQDWKDRTRLPRRTKTEDGKLTGVVVNPDSDLTLLYANNTIYGQFSDGSDRLFSKWKRRGTSLKVTLHNADYFPHGYVNVDLVGGARGWSNQFKSSIKVAGSGAWFTFGRSYWSMNNPKPIIVDPAAKKAGAPDVPGKHEVEIQLNYEPSTRLRFYQFDPMHHDVAVFSVH